MGASVGCALLGTSSGCGSSGGINVVSGAPAGPLPSGYVFHRIFTPGQGPFPEIVSLNQQVLLDETGHVVFTAVHADETMGLYYLTFEIDSSGRPQVSEIRRLVREGDIVAGRVVDHVVSLDINDSGQVALVLAFDVDPAAPQGPQAVVVDRGNGLEIVLDYNDPVPGHDGLFGGSFGDIDMEGDDILVVARFGSDGICGQGIHYLPGGEKSRSEVVLSSFEQIPEADGVIDGFGLIDLDADGQYVAQGFGEDPLSQASVLPRQTGRTGTFSVKGNVRGRFSECRLLSACPSLVLSRSAMGRFDGGDNIYGPRLSGRDETCLLTSTSSGLVLFRDQQIVAQAGSPSPGGNIVRSILPGVFNGTGLLFYELITDVGLELCVQDGLNSALLLSRGDKLEGLGVDTLALGFHSSQADEAGKIVLYAQMDDQAETILLGLPV
jgi:hypothetical protein